MPLTGHGGPSSGMNTQIALGLGTVALLGGLVVALTGIDRWGGMTIAGFGLLLCSMGGMMSERVPPEPWGRILLGLGIIGGLVSFVGAIVLLRTQGVL